MAELRAVYGRSGSRVQMVLMSRTLRQFSLSLRVLRRVLLVIASVCAAQAWSHDSRPVYIEVMQDTAVNYSVTWRVPDSVEAAAVPDINLAGDCRLQYSPSRDSERLHRIRVAYQGLKHYLCATDALPKAVVLDYPQSNPSLSTIVRVTSQEGAVAVFHALPASRRIVLASNTSKAQVAYEYLSLGTQHIWGGFDHLLFVTCLVLMAGLVKRLLLMITGFTVGHSLTLILATLGLIRVPILAVEAVIALSIVFVAAELLRDQKDTWSWRSPLMMAACFGLLHGLGFAGAIVGMGLPENEIVTALLAFNIGVELGQLGYIIGLMLALALYRSFSGGLGLTKRVVVPRVLAGPIGVLAAFWFFERLFLSMA